MRRPALITVGFFTLGISIAYFIDIPVFYLFLSAGMLLVSVIIALALRKSEAFWIQIVLFAMVALSGAFRYEFSTRGFPANHFARLSCFDQEIILEGRTVSEPVSLQKRTRVTVAAGEISTAADTAEVCGRVLVAFKEGTSEDIGYGDSIRVKGWLKRPPPARNPGAFDYQKYLLRRGIFGLISVSSPADAEVLQSAEEGDQGLFGLFISRVILPIRGAIHTGIDRNLTGAPAAVLKGILLGEKRSFREETIESFDRSGVSHILAVSGLHVGLVAAMFFFLFRFFNLSNRWAVPATLLALFLYAFVTDLRPSVVRASIMAAVILVGLVIERDSHIANSLGFAGLIILFIWPQALFDISFQLSFAAVFAIVCLYRPILSLLPGFLNSQQHWWGRRIFSVMALSAAVQLGVAPIVAFYFNRFPLVSVLANIVVIPTVGVILGLGFLASAFGFWCAPAAMIFNAANWLFLKFLLKSVEFFANFPYGSFRVPSPSVFFFLGYFSVLALFVQARRSIRARKLLLIGVLLVAGLWVWNGILGDSGQLKVVFLNAGRGNGAFVGFPNGRKMLINAGPRSLYFDAGRRTVAPFLHHLGVKKLDAVVLTHQDDGRIGGMVTVLEDFQVDNILDNGQPRSSRISNRLWKTAYRKGVRHWIVSAGDTLAGLGEAKAVVLAPRGISGPSPDEPSQSPVILKLTYKGVSVIMTGGARWEETAKLSAWGDELKATVLEIGSFAPQSPVAKELLSEVSPEAIILTGGSRDVYGREELEQAFGGTIYQVQSDGAVTVTVDRRGRLEIDTVISEAGRTR